MKDLILNKIKNQNGFADESDYDLISMFFEYEYKDNKNILNRSNSIIDEEMRLIYMFEKIN